MKKGPSNHNSEEFIEPKEKTRIRTGAHHSLAKLSDMETSIKEEESVFNLPSELGECDMS